MTIALVEAGIILIGVLLGALAFFALRTENHRMGVSLRSHHAETDPERMSSDDLHALETYPDRAREHYMLSANANREDEDGGS